MGARRGFLSYVCVGFGVNTVVVVFAFFDAEGRPVRVAKKAPRTKAITGWTRLNPDPATDSADTVRGPAFVFLEPDPWTCELIVCMSVSRSYAGGTRARARTDPVMQMDVDDAAATFMDVDDADDADNADDERRSGQRRRRSRQLGQRQQPGRRRQHRRH